MQTKVKEIMKRNPETISPDSTLQEAAQIMADVECGILPVGSWKNIEGVITDRDIIVRAIAKGKDAGEEKVRDYMTADVIYCSVGDTLEDAGNRMRENQVSRLMVKDGSGNACGIITFGCILRKGTSLQETSSVVSLATGRQAA